MYPTRLNPAKGSPPPATSSAAWQQGDTRRATLRCATCKFPVGKTQRCWETLDQGRKTAPEPKSKGRAQRRRCQQGWDWGYCCFWDTWERASPGHPSCPDGNLCPSHQPYQGASPQIRCPTLGGLCSCWGAAAGEPTLAQRRIGAAEAGHEWKSLSSPRPHTGVHAPRSAHPIIPLKESQGRWSPRASPPYRRGGQAAICCLLCIFSVTPGLPASCQRGPGVGISLPGPHLPPLSTSHLRCPQFRSNGDAAD